MYSRSVGFPPVRPKSTAAAPLELVSSSAAASPFTHFLHSTCSCPAYCLILLSPAATPSARYSPSSAGFCSLPRGRCLPRSFSSRPRHPFVRLPGHHSCTQGIATSLVAPAVVRCGCGCLAYLTPYRILHTPSPPNTDRPTHLPSSTSLSTSPISHLHLPTLPSRSSSTTTSCEIKSPPFNNLICIPTTTKEATSHPVCLTPRSSLLCCLRQVPRHSKLTLLQSCIRSHGVDVGHQPRHPRYLEDQHRGQQ
jgi:hypothetical protein